MYDCKIEIPKDTTTFSNISHRFIQNLDHPKHCSYRNIITGVRNQCVRLSKINTIKNFFCCKLKSFAINKVMFLDSRNQFPRLHRNIIWGVAQSSVI